MRLIERYIYDVTRRLPEKERSEVKMELEASIADMLPENPSEQDVTGVLEKLGAPCKMAEQYRQQPKYLISPAMYDLYIETLKKVVVIVACVLACVGAVLSIGELPANAGTGDIIRGLIRESLSYAIEGALMSTFWVTVFFVILDRTGNNKKPWSVACLPAVPDKKEVEISRTSTVIGAALQVLFTVVFVTLITGGYIFGGAFTGMSIRGATVINPISQAALERLVPFVIFTSAAALVLAAVKFIWARWNLITCAANAAYNFVWAGIAIYVITWKDLLNEELPAYFEKLNIDVDFPGLFTAEGTVAFLPVAIAVIVMAAIMDIGGAVWNTMKGRR